MTDKKHKFVYLDKFNKVKEAIKSAFDENQKRVYENRDKIFDLETEVYILQKHQQGLKRSIKRHRIALIVIVSIVVYLIQLKY